MQPRITVVIPLYNKAEYIARTIQSVLDQEPPAYEIIVVDDGSTDSSPEIVATMAVQMPLIRLIGQPNGGVSSARNSGIREARGDYIAFLDADDRYLPGFLTEINRLIASFPDAGLYATGYVRVAPNNLPLAEQNPPIEAGTLPLLINDFFRLWSKSSFFCTCSLCIPHHIFKDDKLAFPVGDKLGEDQDVWFRIAERYAIAFSPRPLVEYRVGVAGSLTNGSMVVAPLPCFQRLADRLDGDAYPRQHRAGASRLLSSHYLNVARTRLELGDRPGSWLLMKDPRALSNFLYWLRTLFRFLLPNWFKQSAAETRN
jgi:glycosyltransferase involved in cell wall biosynthesis